MILEILVFAAFWIYVAKRLYDRFFPAPFVKPEGKWVFITVSAHTLLHTPCKVSGKDAENDTKSPVVLFCPMRRDVTLVLATC